MDVDKVSKISMLRSSGSPEALGKKGDKKMKWRRVQGKCGEVREFVSQQWVPGGPSFREGLLSVVPRATGRSGQGKAKFLPCSTKPFSRSVGRVGSLLGVFRSPVGIVEPWTDEGGVGLPGGERFVEGGGIGS